MIFQEAKRSALVSLGDGKRVVGRKEGRKRVGLKS
jgi:hypothetical protein